jgi:hypothetical protein
MPKSTTNSTTTDDIYEELAQEFDQFRFLSSADDSLNVADNELLEDESQVVQQYNLHKISSSQLLIRHIDPLSNKEQIQQQIQPSSPPSHNASFHTIVTPRGTVKRTELQCMKVGYLTMRQQRNFLGRQMQQQDKSKDEVHTPRDTLTCNLLELRDQLPNHIKISVDYLSQPFVTVEDENTLLSQQQQRKKINSTPAKNRKDIEFDSDSASPLSAPTMGSSMMLMNQEVMGPLREEYNNYNTPRLSDPGSGSTLRLPSNPSTPRSSNAEEAETIDMMSSVHAMGSTLSQKLRKQKSVTTKTRGFSVLRKTGSMDALKPLDLKFSTSLPAKSNAGFGSMQMPRASFKEKKEKMVPNLSLDTQQQQDNSEWSDVDIVEETYLISTDETPGLEKLSKYYEDIGRDPNYILETFEDTFPVVESKKELRLNVEMQDLLLTKHPYAHDE